MYQIIALCTSLILHLGASPLAAALGVAACPLLDHEGMLKVTYSMSLTFGCAWLLFWISQIGRIKNWLIALRTNELPPRTLSTFLMGSFYGVFIHFVMFVIATFIGSYYQHIFLGHSIWNWRFWYTCMISAGGIIVLNAVLVDYIISRSFRPLKNSHWLYESRQNYVHLREVVMFALATLPISVLASIVYRKVALDGIILEGDDILLLISKISVIYLVWGLITVSLLRAIERYAAREAQLLIRELGNPEIKRRATLTYGGILGEITSALNHSADKLEQRTRLEHAVRAYVGDEVAEGTRTQDVTMKKGERLRATILFADIRDFTRKSFGKTPEEVVTLLNEYFSYMVGCTEAHSGVVDKFIGDGFLAYFPEPAGSSDFAALRAYQAAVSLLTRLHELNTRLAEKKIEPIQIGIGLHAGEVVCGNIGDAKRKQWTIIGDTVNLASRIESMTKEAGRSLVFTDTVASYAPKEELEFLGEFKVRGQPQPQKCYSSRAVAG